MAERKDLLVSTLGDEVGEIVPGMRSLPHHHMVLVTDISLDERGPVMTLLRRLGISHEVLSLDPLDLTGSAMLIERKVQEHKDRGWRVRVDITGGRKLLSDAATLAALSTGAELCCFESGIRRFPLLAAMGVREALPGDLAEFLVCQRWPVPLKDVRAKGKGDPLPSMLRRMKRMDLIRLDEGVGAPMLRLTERGRACLDWIIRMKELSGSSE
ncbi:MAG: hypothetical protein GXY70_00815 [Euryarchaeota archaeon]|nr:hypothetical protein [Euryarchaeota archaeon]